MPCGTCSTSTSTTFRRSNWYPWRWTICGVSGDGRRNPMLITIIPASAIGSTRRQAEGNASKTRGMYHSSSAVSKDEKCMENILIASLGESPIVITAMYDLLKKEKEQVIDKIVVLYPEKEALISTAFDLIREAFRDRCEVIPEIGRAHV